MRKIAYIGPGRVEMVKYRRIIIHIGSVGDKTAKYKRKIGYIQPPLSLTVLEEVVIAELRSAMEGAGEQKKRVEEFGSVISHK